MKLLVLEANIESVAIAGSITKWRKTLLEKKTNTIWEIEMKLKKNDEFKFLIKKNKEWIWESFKDNRLYKDSDVYIFNINKKAFEIGLKVVTNVYDKLWLYSDTNQYDLIESTKENDGIKFSLITYKSFKYNLLIAPDKKFKEIEERKLVLNNKKEYIITLNNKLNTLYQPLQDSEYFIFLNGILVKIYKIEQNYDNNKSLKLQKLIEHVKNIDIGYIYLKTINLQPNQLYNLFSKYNNESIIIEYTGVTVDPNIKVKTNLKYEVSCKDDQFNILFLIEDIQNPANHIDINYNISYQFIYVKQPTIKYFVDNKIPIDKIINEIITFNIFDSVDKKAMISFFTTLLRKENNIIKFIFYQTNQSLCNMMVLLKVYVKGIEGSMNSYKNLVSIMENLPNDDAIILLKYLLDNTDIWIPELINYFQVKKKWMYHMFNIINIDKLTDILLQFCFTYSQTTVEDLIENYHLSESIILVVKQKYQSQYNELKVKHKNKNKIFSFLPKTNYLAFQSENYLNHKLFTYIYDSNENKNKLLTANNSNYFV